MFGLLLQLLLSVVGGVVAALAFPRFGPGWLIIPGFALHFYSLREATSPRRGLLLGLGFGVAFSSVLLWWFSELGLIALIPLVLLQMTYPGVHGWWMGRYRRTDSGTWAIMAVGGWALIEAVRYRFPFGGFEWGAAGYAMSDLGWYRSMAPFVGTTGLTVAVVALAVAIAMAVRSEMALTVVSPLILIAAFGLTAALISESAPATSNQLEVAIVQGSTPCPFEHCAPNERLRTFEQHLELTRSLQAPLDLVVWAEGSTGSVNADPVQNPEIGALVSAEAKRLNTFFLIGSDRPLNDETWVNANVLFNPDGHYVTEYQKQHPVPFGEYIPARPVFDWIPELSRVPRDMIPGDRPVVFDLGMAKVGSVISFEGAFSRYARQHVQEGAQILAVLTNEGSYGLTPGSDQLIGMTRMRAAELEIPVIHAAVTGRSVFIDRHGELGKPTDLGTQEVARSTVVVRSYRSSPYAKYGDAMLYATALFGVVVWARERALVGSRRESSEEE